MHIWASQPQAFQITSLLLVHRGLWVTVPSCQQSVSCAKEANAHLQIVSQIETACEYFTSVMRNIQEEKIRSVEPKRRATDQFHQHMSAFHKGTVWGQPCRYLRLWTEFETRTNLTPRSWYKNGTTDGDPQLWCGSALTYVKTIRSPRYEDYEIEYQNENQWAFLGNGKAKAHYELIDGKPNIKGLAPYMRNEDALWEI